MLGSKLDLFKLDWIDVVFAGRNKAYGAYELRKDNSKTTSRALIIGSILFVLAVSSPIIIKYISGFIPEKQEEKIIQTEVVLTPPPPVDEKTPPPTPPAEPPRPRVNQVKFPPPVVVPKEQVRDEEPPTVEELKTADPGQKKIEGDPNAEVRIDEPVGEAPKGAAVTEDNGVHDFASVEVLPEFPGGIQKFYQYVAKNYNYPAAAKEQGVSGRVTVSFIVEKDGSLTDIKVLRDLGMGTGEEAVRLLKKSPKWKPGIQNGRPVRVAYTIPIMLNLEVQ
ncbi:energy transducer TonB (plasmid) [Pedobacter sp. BS3]|uniref:energy transducer TonB n=1 Tax=Pedobacter sp. BS3 TaxID=2567937 RepID=UPI0011EE58CB|nr:energy transducer TonB [Pedobacter sp. BS3]TZF86334.1 energy transducer TonB [Pedobacter sp. BS3]